MVEFSDCEQYVRNANTGSKNGPPASAAARIRGMIHGIGWRWWVVIAAIALMAALWPLKSQSAPDWTVRVVDESNAPVSGVLVRESYQNYSAEWSGHEEDQYSDSRGCARFAPKMIRSSLLKRLAVTITSALGGVHASFGPYDYVTAFSGNLRGDDVRGGLEFAWKGTPSHVDSLLTLRPH